MLELSSVGGLFIFSVIVVGLYLVIDVIQKFVIAAGLQWWRNRRLKGDPDSNWKARYYRTKSAMDTHEEARLPRSQLAFLYEKQGRKKEALELLDTLIYGSPGGASYHVWLIDRAGVNIKLDRLKQALNDCNEVIAYAEKGDNRMLAQGLFARGVARALLGESLAATEDYEKALQLQPDLPRALEHSDDQIKMKSQLDMALSRFVENAVFGSTPADLRTIERRKKEFQPQAQAIHTKSAGLWAFILGPLFFMHHKCWGDAIKLLFIDLAVAAYVKESGGKPILAVALVQLVYAVSASGIIRRAYEHRG